MRRWRVVAGVLMALTVFGVAGAGGQDAPAEGAAAAGGAKEGEVELVTALKDARRKYEDTLRKLHVYYKDNQDPMRAKWAEEELVAYHRINKQVYRVDLQLHPAILQAKKNYPEANDLYRMAMTYKGKGYGTDFNDNQVRATVLFNRLLDKYPDSDKIGDAAYALGEIYEGKPYQQYQTAAVYYERSIKWNPGARSQARIRAARLYDKQLRQQADAIRLYKEVITHETDQAMIQEAEKRLDALGGSRGGN